MQIEISRNGEIIKRTVEINTLSLSALPYRTSVTILIYMDTTQPHVQNLRDKSTTKLLPYVVKALEFAKKVT